VVPAVAPAGETLPVPTGVRAVSRSTIVAVGGAVVLALSAFALAFGSGSSGTVAVDGGAPLDSQGPGSSSEVAGAGKAVAGGEVVVEIVGAVSHPGVFRMARDARVGDLLTAAGGYGPRVDAARAGRELNLAASLHDGDQVRVPSRDDEAAAGVGGAGASGSVGGASAGSVGPIDLNRASASELDTLPGIGPATAAKIIASRDGQPFTAVGDLRTRKLVGEKTFDGLKDLVTVR
jgi:competence protein ComEA